jgi:flagellar biosynthesis/type III secretory pathway chaperone
VTDSARSAESGELAQILRSGIEWMRGLKDALLDERAALERRDTEALAATARSKEQLARKLLSVDRLSSEIETLGRAADADKRNDGGPDERLHGLLRTFRTVARDCERLNLTNGTIIRSRQRQVAEGLAVLRGRDRDEDTYTRAGSSAASGTRRVLTEA